MASYDECRNFYSYSYFLDFYCRQANCNHAQNRQMDKVDINNTMRSGWFYILISLFLITTLSWSAFVQRENGRNSELDLTVSNAKVKRIERNLSCPYLGISALERVEKYGNGRSIHSLTNPNFNWTMGMFPYQTCEPHNNSSTGKKATTRSIDVVMTVADKSYSDVIPAWARIVRASNKMCAIAALDEYVCQIAQDLHCHCNFVGNANAVSSKQRTGWHNARVAGVKHRFLGALLHLYENRSVFMHDADVFFSKNSVTLLDEHFRAIQDSSVHGFDFIVQSNGLRDTAYDGLNWGIALMHPTPQSIALLECTIERWDDEAFGCHRRSKCDVNYYRRSQPRINHILEEAISKELAAPRVCKFKENMFNTGHRHFTGYTSAQTKIVCGGLSNGFLFNESQKTISYSVSGNETPAQQRLVLQSALELAAQTGRKLEMPRSYFHGSECEFCMLFSIKTLESNDLFSARSSQQKCDTELPSGHVSELKNGIISSNSLRFCIPISSLLALTQSDHGKLAQNRHHVLLCDPRNPAYRSIHMCTRKTSDEI